MNSNLKVLHRLLLSSDAGITFISLLELALTFFIVDVIYMTFLSFSELDVVLLWASRSVHINN